MTRMDDAALLESEKRYKTLIENINDLVFETLMDGTLLYLSPSFERIFDGKAEDYIGMNFMAFVYPEDRPFIMDVFANNRFSEHKYIEYRIVTPNQEIKWVQTSARTEYDALQKPLKRIGLLRDISDLRLAEEKLRQSDETFKNILSRINDVVYEVDLNGSILYVSPAVMTVLGFSPEEVLGTNIFQYIYAEDRLFVKNLLETVDKRIDKYIEYRYVSKDGSIRWVRSSTTPKYEHGILVGGTGTLNDITSKKLAEFEQIKLSQAINQNPVSIVITNLDGDIEFANPKACQTTGYDLEELIGKNPRVLKSGETPTKEYDQLWDSISNGSIWKGIFHNKRKNGELYWESSQITPIQDSNGHIMSYLAIKEDITDRKIAEEKIKHQNERLNAILRAIPDLIYIVNAEGTFLEYFNSDLEYNLIPDNQIVGTNLKDFFDSKTTFLFLEKIKEALRTKKLQITEYTIQRPNAPIKHFEARIVAHDVDKVLILSRDVTEQFIQDKELRKMSMAVQQSPVITVVTDLNARIEYVNPAFEKITGYTLDEVSGKNVRILKSNLTDQALYKEL